MPQLQQRVMQALYGHDIWASFRPSRPAAATIQGWNGDHPSLTRLATAGAPKVVVDVGVWKGQSTITMAAAMKRDRLDGCVIAVDTFLGSFEHWEMPWDGPLFNRTYGFPDLYQTFLENVHYAAVADYVVPLPQTSTTAALLLQQRGISAAVVHIDAAHEFTEVIRDAEEYWKILSSGGYLIGDDYYETWPGVVRAAGEFSAKVGRPLAIEIPKWIMQKR